MTETTELDEDGIDLAAWAVWENYPEALPAWVAIPEMSLKGVSRASFRIIARAVVRAYLGQKP